MNVTYTRVSTVRLVYRGTNIDCFVYRVMVDNNEFGFCVAIPEFVHAEPVLSSNVPLEYYSHYNDSDLYCLPRDSDEHSMIRLIQNNKTDAEVKLFGFIRNRKAMVQ